MQVEKRFSQSCENNKVPILRELETHFVGSSQVLEIGSGTGQHAAFFATNLPHVTWHTSDMPVNHGSIKAWLAECSASNLHAPIQFTIGVDDWPELNIDAVFSANTAHIMQPEETRLMMELIGRQLPDSGVFCQYGPFNVEGQYTSQGNANFDRHLAAEGCGGIRDIQELQNWAPELKLIERIPMPANNFLLVWHK